MSKVGMIRTGTSSVNYLDDRLLSSYFEAREHETYYRSLKHVDTCRDFHEVLIPVLMDLVGEVCSARHTQVLDAILATPAGPQKAVEAATAPAEEARRLHPSGVLLLGIGERLDFESLKSSYRRAAIRCHPDKRGSHDQMILVNEAYSLFHEMLCGRQLAAGLVDRAGEGVGIELDAPIRTAQDYLYVIGLLLLDIKLDEWGLDDAHYWVTMLASDEWTASSYARHPRTRANLLCQCSALAGRLWAAGLRDQSEGVRRFAEGLLRSGETDGLHHGGLFEADAYMRGEQKLRLVLNHRRQAENALRIGLIDEKRYKKTIERLDGKRARKDDRIEVLRQFVSEFGFLQDLPTDRAVRGKIVRAGLIPEPGYFDDRVDRLSDDQQAEYLRAFDTSADLRLVEKYAQVRLGGLLRSMIIHAEEVEPGLIERECRAFAQIQGASKGDAFSQVADVARFLAEQSLAQRRTRLEILRQLNDRSSDDDVTTITLDLSSGSMQSSHADSTFLARPTSDYLDLIRLPLARLGLALRTGSAKTKQEETREREVWCRDMNLLKSPELSESRSAAHEASGRATDEPEGYIEAVQTHVELLLGLGERMEHVQELQIGYWIDSLTIALVRSKRWEEAERRLDAFFSLPDRYRGRSSPSQLEAMRKRLERCRKMTGG